MELFTSLKKLYDNDDYDQLAIRLQRISNQLDPIDIDSIIYILEDTTDLSISGLCLETLYANRPTILSTLTTLFQTTESQKLRSLLMTVLCIKPTLNIMVFIIKHYISSSSLRPQIQTSAFRDKSTLLLGLSYYVEQKETLSSHEIEIVQTLLCTIPRKEFTETEGKLAHLKIYELYLLIDPKKRRL